MTVITDGYITNSDGVAKRLAEGYVGNAVLFQTSGTVLDPEDPPVDEEPTIYGTLHLEDPFSIATGLSSFASTTETLASFVNAIKGLFTDKPCFSTIKEGCGLPVFNALTTGTGLDWTNSQASWLAGIREQDIMSQPIRRSVIAALSVDRLSKTSWTNNIRWLVKEISNKFPTGDIKGWRTISEPDVPVNFTNLFSAGQDTADVTLGLNNLVEAQLAAYQELRSGPFTYRAAAYPGYVLSPALSTTVKAIGTQLFSIYTMLAHSSGAMLNYCDAVAVHNKHVQHRIQNFNDTYAADSLQSLHHYWAALSAASALNPGKRKPLVIDESGVRYTGVSSFEGTYSDKYALASYKIGLSVCWQMYWAASAITHTALAGYADDALNAIGSDLLTTTRAPMAATVLDRFDYRKYDVNDFEVGVIAPKTWSAFHKGETWAVHADITSSTPAGSGIPFPEWGRVTFADNQIRLTAGGRNVLFRPLLLRDLGPHTFSIDVRAAVGSVVRLEARGYDKLNGLEFERAEATSASATAWVTLSVTFTPVPHGVAHLPDSPSVVMVIDHDGEGLLEVKGPNLFLGTTRVFAEEQVTNWTYDLRTLTYPSHMTVAPLTSSTINSTATGVEVVAPTTQPPGFSISDSRAADLVTHMGGLADMKDPNQWLIIRSSTPRGNYLSCYFGANNQDPKEQLFSTPCRADGQMHTYNVWLGQYHIFARNAADIDGSRDPARDTFNPLHGKFYRYPSPVDPDLGLSNPIRVYGSEIYGVESKVEFVKIAPQPEGAALLIIEHVGPARGMNRINQEYVWGVRIRNSGGEIATGIRLSFASPGDRLTVTSVREFTDNIPIDDDRTLFFNVRGTIPNEFSSLTVTATCAQGDSVTATGRVWLDPVKPSGFVDGVCPAPVPIPRNQKRATVFMWDFPGWDRSQHIWTLPASFERRPEVGFYDQNHTDHINWKLYWAVSYGVDCLIVEYYDQNLLACSETYVETLKRAQHIDKAQFFISQINHAGTDLPADRKGNNAKWTYTSGTTAPSPTTGAVNGFHWDRTAKRLYGPKTSTGWPTQFVQLPTAIAVEADLGTASDPQDNRLMYTCNFIDYMRRMIVHMGHPSYRVENGEAWFGFFDVYVLYKSLNNIIATTPVANRYTPDNTTWMSNVLSQCKNILLAKGYPGITGVRWSGPVNPNEGGGDAGTGGNSTRFTDMGFKTSMLYGWISIPTTLRVSHATVSLDFAKNTRWNSLGLQTQSPSLQCGFDNRRWVSWRIPTTIFTEWSYEYNRQMMVDCNNWLNANVSSDPLHPDRYVVICAYDEYGEGSIFGPTGRDQFKHMHSFREVFAPNVAAPVIVVPRDVNATVTSIVAPGTAEYLFRWSVYPVAYPEEDQCTVTLQGTSLPVQARVEGLGPTVPPGTGGGGGGGGGGETGISVLPMTRGVNMTGAALTPAQAANLKINGYRRNVPVQWTRNRDDLGRKTASNTPTVNMTAFFRDSVDPMPADINFIIDPHHFPGFPQEVSRMDTTVDPPVEISFNSSGGTCAAYYPLFHYKDFGIGMRDYWVKVAEGCAARTDGRTYVYDVLNEPSTPSMADGKWYPELVTVDTRPTQAYLNSLHQAWVNAGMDCPALPPQLDYDYALNTRDPRSWKATVELIRDGIRSKDTRNPILYEMPWRGGVSLGGVSLGPSQNGVLDDQNWFVLDDVNAIIGWHGYEKFEYNVTGGLRGRATITEGSNHVVWTSPTNFPDAEIGDWIVGFSSTVTGGNTPGFPDAVGIPVDTKITAIQRTTGSPIVMSVDMDKPATVSGSIAVNIQPPRPTLAQITAYYSKIRTFQLAHPGLQVFFGEAGTIWYAKEIPSYAADLIGLLESYDIGWLWHTINMVGGSFDANRDPALMEVLQEGFALNPSSRVWYTNMAPGNGIAVARPTGTNEVAAYGDFAVNVDGVPVPVYVAKVAVTYTYPGPATTENVGFCNVDITGSCSVTVAVSNRTVTSAKVYPEIYGVTPTISGNTVTVPIPHCGKYALHINDSERSPLYIFANPVETNVPVAGANVTIYEPGIHDVGHVTIAAGKTVYIKAGAVVNGKFTLNGANIKIRGRGILNASGQTTGSALLVYGDNAVIEGITVLDSPGWTCSLWGPDNVLVDNVKIFGWRDNSDGIDICSVVGCVVQNVYIRSRDDGVTVKANAGGVVEDILVKDSVIMPDYGWRAIGIGAETQEPYMRNITFQNIDVMFAHSNRAIDIEAADQAAISDVLFADIRVKNHHGYSLSGQSGLWIGMEIVQNGWSTGTGPGTISGVTFRNVALSGTQMNSTFTGYDASHQISNVVFDNVTKNEVKVTNAAGLPLTSTNTVGITFR